jgi:hypothetical protein
MGAAGRYQQGSKLRRGWRGFAALIVTFAIAACDTRALTGAAKDGSPADGRTGDGSVLPVFAACLSFCDVENRCCLAVQGCDAEGHFLACHEYRCTPESTTGTPFESQPESCQNAYKAWYDCLSAQPTACDPTNSGAANVPGACTAEAHAIADAHCAS